MKRYLKLIIMACVLTVLVAGALLQKHFFPAEPDADYTDDGGSKLMYAVNDVSAEGVSEISYTSDGKTLSFGKNGEEWVLLRDGAPNIDSELIAAMVKAVAGASGSNKMENVPAEKLADYGLDSPALTVSVKVAGNERIFLFGNMNKTAKEYYFCEKGKEETVFTVSASAYEAFSYTLSELVVPDTLPEISADSIERVSLGDTEIKKVKTPTDENEEGYEYSALRIKDGEEEDFSYADFYAIAESFSGWKLEIAECEECDEAEYGFDGGEQTLTVCYTEKQEISAEGTSGGYIETEKSFSLLLGKSESDGSYYCKTDKDSAVIYKIAISGIEKIS